MVARVPKIVIENSGESGVRSMDWRRPPALQQTHNIFCNRWQKCSSTSPVQAVVAICINTFCHKTHTLLSNCKCCCASNSNPRDERLEHHANSISLEQFWWWHSFFTPLPQNFTFSTWLKYRFRGKNLTPRFDKQKCLQKVWLFVSTWVAVLNTIYRYELMMHAWINIFPPLALTCVFEALWGETKITFS